MAEITLEITSPTERRTHRFAGQTLSIGRGETADLRIEDASLSRLHAQLEQAQGEVYVLDYDSSNGTTVNGQAATAKGIKLRDGDVIRLGAHVSIRVRMAATAQPVVPATPAMKSGKSSLWPAFLGLAIGLVVFTGVAVGAKAYRDYLTEATPTPLPEPTETPSLAEVSPTPAPPVDLTTDLATPPPLPQGNTQVKLYRSMSEEERYEFLRTSAQQITRMMGNREYVFERDVLAVIKNYVDGYARRVGNGSHALWSEDPRFIYTRATEFAPLIIKAFRAADIPIVLGLYIPVIETEYYTKTCLVSPAKCVGIYQFSAKAAIDCGVNPSDRCDVVKMAPAAACYMKKRLIEFGTDSMSVALSIAGYNRSPVSVKKDLAIVINSKNQERTFWTLLANKEELDHWFQNENVKYVPKFFAAAIVGEFPAHFGLNIRKLSTYDTHP